MPRELGLGDTHYEHDIHGEVDFDFFESSQGQQKQQQDVVHDMHCSPVKAKVADVEPRCGAGEQVLGAEGGYDGQYGADAKHQPVQNGVTEHSGHNGTIPKHLSEHTNHMRELDNPLFVIDDLTDQPRATTSSASDKSDTISDSLSSDDEDEDESFTSDSDITQVSPMSSASVSPLPFLPRPRTEPMQESKPVDPPHATDMKLLVEALNELEQDRAQRSMTVTLRPQSHHLHRNMSFTADQVRKIDRENQILLRKIMEHKRPRVKNGKGGKPKSVRVASSAIGRMQQQKRIQQENLMLLKKIQDAKPSKEVSEAFNAKCKSNPNSRSLSRLLMTPERSHAKSEGSLSHRRGSTSSSSSKAWIP